jgi:hypothetical protein
LGEKSYLPLGNLVVNYYWDMTPDGKLSVFFFFLVIDFLAMDVMVEPES